MARRRITILATFHGANANNASVNSASHTVILLVVHLGNLVVFNDASLANITKRRSINHVFHNKPLHCLVLLGLAATAVAENRCRHAAAVLGASIIAPLLRHAEIEICPVSTTTILHDRPFYNACHGFNRDARHSALSYGVMRSWGARCMLRSRQRRHEEVG